MLALVNNPKNDLDAQLTQFIHEETDSKTLGLVQDTLLKTLSMNPEEPHLLRLLAETYFKQERYEAALMCIEKADGLNKNLHFSSIMRTRIYVKQGRLQEAAEQLMMFHSDIPQEQQKDLKDGEYHLIQGHYQVARKKFIKVLNESANSELVKIRLLQAYMENGAMTEAQDLKKSLHYPSLLGFDMFVRGVIFSKCGFHEEALHTYRSSLAYFKQSEKMASVQYNIALSLYRLKRYRQASEVISKISDIRGLRKRTRKLLDKISKRDNQFERTVIHQHSNQLLNALYNLLPGKNFNLKENVDFSKKSFCSLIYSDSGEPRMIRYADE